ncbi:MAG: glycosyl hydrolase family 28 protein [Saccharofermentanales bacterium]
MRFKKTFKNLSILIMAMLLFTSCKPASSPEISKTASSQDIESIVSEMISSNSILSSAQNSQNSSDSINSADISSNAFSNSSGSKASVSKSSSSSVSTPKPTVTTPSSNISFTAVTYPKDTVKTLAANGWSKASFEKRAEGTADYIGNQGYDSTGIIISPYFQVKANNTAIPAYATPVFVYQTGSGFLHSYSMIDVSTSLSTYSFNLELTTSGFALADAIVLPSTLKVIPKVISNKVTAKITGPGIYTFLFNSGSQDYAYTLFVRKYVDENAEINKYKSENYDVMVYEAGVHNVNYINIQYNNTVIYLRRGALLIANHVYDINKKSDETTRFDPGASGETGIGLPRYPFINCVDKTDVIITGRGTIDFSKLDWHERNGISIINSSNIEVNGITLINCPNWSLYTYKSTDVRMHDICILGYKTNSDGIEVCNSQDVSVYNCYARNGDDLFGVKTLGGDSFAICKNVTFTNCIAWAGKARAFGITSEVYRDISDILFKDCAVIYRDATWDNNILGSLVIVAGEGSGNIDKVTFENIEIYCETGRPINIVCVDNMTCKITNVLFKNISYNLGKNSQLSTNNRSTNSISATFSNVKCDGVKIDSINFPAYFDTDQYCSYSFR